MEEENEPQLRRRRLLRGAGAVVAGVAGAGVTGAVAATPASADTGENVILGKGDNDANATTGIQLEEIAAAAQTPTLRLANAGGPALQIEPGFPTDGAPVGSVFVDSVGDIATIGDASAFQFVNYLYSPNWALMPFPFGPFRWLDTRTAAGLANVVPGSGTVANQRIQPKADPTVSDLMLDFSGILNENYVAVQMIISVLGASNDGWVSVWGDGEWPGTVSVNFLGGRVIGGYAQSELTGVFVDSIEPFGRLKINITHAAVVTIDVVGFLTPDYFTLFKELPEATSSVAKRRTPKMKVRRQG